MKNGLLSLFYRFLISKKTKPLLWLGMLIFLFGIRTNGQTPGYIFNPSTTVITLDPNLDHYSSATTTGFTTNDLTQSEILFYPIPTPFNEPAGDVRRGSDCSAIDFVWDSDGNGAYVFYDGTNLIFRFRMGSYSPGAFGFNVLIDTDYKFGNTGTYADPTYFPQTTGSNGNPGFEYEVVWEKNFRVAVYNVNNTGTTPVFLTSYSEATNTQVSKAFTNDCGDPDYFMDFFIPLSALPGVTSSTPLRMVATSSTSPAPAIGGTVSDIDGINDDQYPVLEDAFTTIINTQPPFTPGNVGSGGSGTGATCTVPPVISTPISSISTSISGTWTSLTGITTATISVYKNNSFQGTSSATSGGTWTYSPITLAPGDVLYAKAASTGESECLQSESVTVVDCAPTTTTTAPTVTCFTTRGAQGTMPSGATIKIYRVLSTGLTDAGTTNLTYPTSTTWEWQSTTISGTGVCTGGPNDVPDGTYYVTATQTGKCESGASSFWCIGYGTTTTAPVISQSTLYYYSASVSGTAPNPSTVRLFINGILKNSVSSTGTFSFTGLVLSIGDVVEVTAQASGQCMSTVVSRTVTCKSSIPIITSGSGNIIAAGSLIQGTSSENSGTVVSVYNGSGTLLGTATVNSSGYWTSTVVAAAGTTYYAKQTTSSCGISDASATVSVLATNTSCPTITTPVSETSPTVSGTVTAVSNQTIRLYEDGTLIGSVVTSTGSWSITISSSYPLYAGGVLTATSQVIGTNVESSCSQNITVSCTPPTAPTISPTTFTICYNSTISVPVTGSTSGLIYTLRDQAGTTYYSNSVTGTGSNISLTSYSLLANQTLKVFVSKPGNYTCESGSNNIAAVIDSVAGGTVGSNQSILTGGDPAAFTVVSAATGSGALTYQWQSSTSGPSSGFSNIGGATSATYDPPSGLTTTTYYKRITTSTLNSVACTAESNVITVTIGSCISPNITVEPSTPSAICSGNGTAILQVTATGTNIGYQWYVDGTTALTNTSPYSGVTTSTLTITNPSYALNGKQYKVIVSGDCAPNDTSITVTLTVDPASVGGSITGSATVCSGANSTLLTLSGYTGTITKWQSSTNNWVNTTDISNTSDTYTATNLTATTKYRAVVTSGVCSSANSSEATVTVDPVSVGGSISGSATVCSGNNSTVLTLSGYTGTITKWQSSTNNWVSTTDIANTSDTYTATNLTVTTKYRAVVTSGVCSSANSSEATVTVDPVSVGGSISGSATVCSGTNSTVLTLAGYTGTITKWQSSTNNWVSTTDIANTSNTYTATNLTVTTKYRAVVTSGVCSSSNSSEATVTVDPVSVGGSIAGSATVCSGTNSTLLTLSGYTGTITKWQSSTNNWVNTTDIANTSDTYTATNLTVTTKYRAVVTSGVCSSANSSEATVTVNTSPLFTSCPANISLNNETDKCSAVATYTASANGSPSPTLTYEFTGATTGSGNGTGSGSTFNVGITNVKITASNSCGNVYCNFTITVSDTQLPEIICPPDISASVNLDCTLTGYDIGTPTSDDNCTVLNVSNNHPTGTYSLGETSVIWTATDASANSATCTQKVTATNTGPTGNTDSYTVNQFYTTAPTSVSGNVLLNDVDSEGQTLRVSSWGTPSSGSLTTNSNGVFTYTPAVGYTGNISFSYTVCDPCNQCTSSTVNITVAACTAPPSLPGPIKIKKN